MRLGTILLSAVAVLAPWGWPLALGEVFELVGGGQVAGDLLNPDESPRKSYVIRLGSGGQVTLAADQVKRRVPQSPDEQEYEKIRAGYPDTVEGQWALAEWCREHRLTSQREVHLRRILALDTNHRGARAALGYSQVDGKWQTQEEVMTARGYERFQGSWRSPQEIRAIKEREELRKAESKWFVDLRRYSGWLGGPRSDEAQRSIEEIKDPAAIKPLAALLEEDRRRAAQSLYAAALARIGAPAAIKVLAVRAIEDPDEEVRLACLDQLKKERRPDVIAYFCGRLRDKDNRVVNLAGRALREMRDLSAVGPLIDALITTHKYKVTVGQPGQTSASFGNGPGAGGLTVGSKTKIFVQDVRNQDVLEALLSLAGGANYNFDVPAWKSWFAAQNQRAPLDARRD